MPTEVPHNFRAKPVWTGGLKELRHFQENSSGVVAEVYRAKQEGRRPSDEQQSQGCAELRLHFRRWNSLRAGPDDLLTMSVASKHRQSTRERVVCPTAIRWELIRDTHQWAHTGAQRVLTKLQLQLYWPYIEHDVRRRVRRCKTCQASQHGCPPDNMGLWMQNVEGPWQAEAVDLVGSVSMTPQGDVARRGRPLPPWEARPLPSAPGLPPPLPGSSEDPEVQNPPIEGAPCGDTRKTTTVTIRLKVPLVRHNRPRVSTLPPAVTTLPGQHTMQPPAYQTDKVCDRTNSRKYKIPIKYRTGRRSKKRGSCEHHGNNNFCLGGSMNEIHAPETQSPSHVAQPRCLFFSYADAVKCRRT